jgi:hypothetical protein
MSLIPNTEVFFFYQKQGKSLKLFQVNIYDFTHMPGTVLSAGAN